MRLGSVNSHLKCLQYDWVREFPDYKKCSAKNLSIDLLISNSHGPSTYTLSMHQTQEVKFFLEKKMDKPRLVIPPNIGGFR